MCVRVHMCMCMYVCTRRSEVSLGCWPLRPDHLLAEVSHWYLGSPRDPSTLWLRRSLTGIWALYLGWVVWPVPWTSVLYFTSSCGITRVFYQPCLFTWVLGINFMSSRVQQVLYHQSYPPPCLQFTSGNWFWTVRMSKQ